MARQGDLAAGSRVTPNFVASGSGPIEPVAEPSQPTRDLPVPETGKTSHLRHADGHEQVDAGIGFDQIGEGGREWVAMLDTRLGDLPGKALGEFSGLGDAAPLRDQTRNVGARGQKTAIGQLLNAESEIVASFMARPHACSVTVPRGHGMLNAQRLMLPMNFLRRRPRSGAGATANAEPCLTPD